MSRQVDQLQFYNGHGQQQVHLPLSARIIHFGYVGANYSPTIWYERDSGDYNTVPRDFHLVQEYNTVPDGAQYVMTAVESDFITPHTNPPLFNHRNTVNLYEVPQDESHPAFGVQVHRLRRRGQMVAQA